MAHQTPYVIGRETAMPHSAGQIKEFWLTDNKQKPDRLIGFCADQVKTITPTVVEFAAKDSTPDKGP